MNEESVDKKVIDCWSSLRYCSVSSSIPYCLTGITCPYQSKEFYRVMTGNPVHVCNHYTEQVNLLSKYDLEKLRKRSGGVL